MKIYTHPDNVAEVRRGIEKELNAGKIGFSFLPVEIYANPYLEKEKPSGRYILPDGRVVAKSEVRVREGFWEWGPDDVKVLLWWGIIREEMEIQVIVQRFDFRLGFRLFDNLPIISPPQIVVNYMS